ncbi:MAG: anti-sigma factor antagonist [Micromonosporaceae bacterium]
MSLEPILPMSGHRPRAARLALDSRCDGDGTVVIAACGEIDMGTAPRLRDALTAALAGDSVRRVLLDMSGVTFLDSSGIAALIDAHHAAARGDRTVRLSNTCPFVTRVLEITGLAETLGLGAA